MFARVIPLARLPFGVDAFDYLIPETLMLHVGTIVTIPFRRGVTQGIVQNILPSSPFARQCKPVSAIYAENLRVPHQVVELIAATAKRTFSSQGTVAKSFFRQLPKKPAPSTPTARTTDEHGIQAWWGHAPAQALLAQARAKAQTARVLIVCAAKHRAEAYARELEASCITGDTAAGAAYRAWSEFLATTRGCLVVTKVGAWLSACAEYTLLDTPESDEHKQDELSPRYDARKIVLWYAAHSAAHVQSFGLTPPLHSDTDAPNVGEHTVILLRQRQGASTIPHLQAQALQQLLDHDGPRIIIHPIRGSLARLRCRDCSHTFTCERCDYPLSLSAQHAVCKRCHAQSDLPAQCPTCGGSDFSKSVLGIERLQRVWQETCPDVPVEWRSADIATLEQPFPHNACIVITEPAFISGGEDVRRNERLCQTMRRLADMAIESDSTLYAQCEEAFGEQLAGWLSTEGYRAFQLHERGERALFGYPPARRLIKCVIRGNESVAQQWLERAVKASSSIALEWSGLLPTPFLPSSRTPRWIVHARCDSTVSEHELYPVLEPLIQAGVTIDLDPVAFLE